MDSKALKRRKRKHSKHKLRDYSPCAEGLARVRRAGGTLRLAWDSTLTLSDQTWLLNRAHIQGKLSRRRLVDVTLRCVLTTAHLLPPHCLPLLADLQAWCSGDDSVDVTVVRNALWRIGDGPTVADAVYAARCCGTAAADGNARSATYKATYAVADAYTANSGTSYIADAAAMTSVIADAIDIDEVCKALDLDPDEVVA